MLLGINGGPGEIKIASASTPSANDQAKDIVLVHTSQLIKTNDKSTNLRKNDI